MSTVAAWLRASRPLAQANIAVPLVFGQALAFAVTGRFDTGMCVLIHVFGLVDQLFIVYANDYADAEADRANDSPTPFSGGSRVIVDGELPRSALGYAAVGMAGLVLAIGAYLALFAERPLALPLVAVALLLLWAYSFPPIRLSYRGEGEVLQGLGVGVVLPLFAYYVQAGSLAEMPLLVLVATFLVGYAGNITTALPDTPADAATDKRTLSVRFGLRPAAAVSLVLVAVAASLSLVAGPPVDEPARSLAVGAPLALLALNAISLRGLDGRGAALRFVFVNGLAMNALLVAWAVGLFLRGTP